MRAALDIAATASITFLGIGEVDDPASMCENGCLIPADLAWMRAAGGIAEIIDWAFDGRGRHERPRRLSADTAA
jgi:DNA-binding transcriptional regulator LsrR (DeoR family)